MTGWKSKAGAWCVFLAGLCEAASRTLPPSAADFAPWLTFVATITAAAGASLLGAGIAHKIEKASQ